MATLQEIENKLPDAMAICLSKGDHIEPYCNEIWIRFRDRSYIFISLEQPFPTHFELLTSSQGWFHCTEHKKQDFIQQQERPVILGELQDALNCDYNLPDTIQQTMQLVSKLNQRVY